MAARLVKTLVDLDRLARKRAWKTDTGCLTRIAHDGVVAIRAKAIEVISWVTGVDVVDTQLVSRAACPLAACTCAPRLLEIGHEGHLKFGASRGTRAKLELTGIASATGRLSSKVDNRVLAQAAHRAVGDLRDACRHVEGCDAAGIGNSARIQGDHVVGRKDLAGNTHNACRATVACRMPRDLVICGVVVVREIPVSVISGGAQGLGPICAGFAVQGAVGACQDSSRSVVCPSLAPLGIVNARDVGASLDSVCGASGTIPCKEHIIAVQVVKGAGCQGLDRRRNAQAANTTTKGTCGNARHILAVDPRGNG